MLDFRLNDQVHQPIERPWSDVMHIKSDGSAEQIEAHKLSQIIRPLNRLQGEEDRKGVSGWWHNWSNGF